LWRTRRASIGGVLVLLPPSESKDQPRRGRPVALDGLSRPELSAPRTAVLDALQRLCAGDTATALEVLGLGPNQLEWVAHNAVLNRAPAAPAGRVYTGVLYSSLDYPGLSGQDLRRANRRLGIVSALFGLLRPSDRICAYRLSGSVRLPGIGSLPRFWRDPLTAVVAEEPGLVVDMLSSPYASMAVLPPNAVTVKVWQEGPAGQRTAVSHFNKSTKGGLARLLATVPDAPSNADELLQVVRAAGWAADLDGARLDVLRSD
jgi:cytoplasmic iron level regulating protein YaaA (DUF328/UPF0246 family)